MPRLSVHHADAGGPRGRRRVVPRQAQPCIWIHMGGFTFRWARGDDVMIVQRGKHLGDHGIADIVAQVPVHGDWQDSAEVRVRANYWLAQQTAKRLG